MSRRSEKQEVKILINNPLKITNRILEKYKNQTRKKA